MDRKIEPPPIPGPLGSSETALPSAILAKPALPPEPLRPSPNSPQGGLRASDKQETHASDEHGEPENIFKDCLEILARQPSWLVSFCFHATSLLVLALLVFQVEQKSELSLSLNNSNFTGELLEFDAFELESEPAPELEVEQDVAIDIGATDLQLDVVDDLVASIKPVGETIDLSAMVTDLPIANVFNPDIPGGISGRNERRVNAIGHGATKESEEAVDRALVWLADHQDSSGGWRFNLACHACAGGCADAGTGRTAVNAATALGLLPFLGAGHTHEQGIHRATVKRGLRFLLKNQDSDGSFFDRQGTMYSHGLATLTLCEALAMARHWSSTDEGKFNKQLRKATQRAIDFTVESQHRRGGWRYQPNSRGDTSVVGWQAMALQSAKMSSLKVEDKVMKGVARFLDSVQGDQYGASYGYMYKRDRESTTPIGLLCRMYLGWDRTHPGISQGVRDLSEIGPSANNVYYSYYATQVMHHHGGPLWEEWNELLRDHLVDTQEIEGSEKGSWYFDGDFGSGLGGRLYITSLACMTLEVYYRHMPIYSSQAVNKLETLDLGEQTED